MYYINCNINTYAWPDLTWNKFYTYLYLTYNILIIQNFTLTRFHWTLSTRHASPSYFEVNVVRLIMAPRGVMFYKYAQSYK